MDFVINNWALIAVALVSGGLLMWPAIRGGTTGGGLSTANAVLLMNREKAVVVDVSEAEEYAGGHITGARNIPLNQLEQALPQQVKNKSLPVVLVCPNGGRAQRALAIAKNLGYDKAVVLGGGLAAWKEANLPLEKA